MTDPKAGHHPTCPRCAFGDPPPDGEFCQVCALLRSGVFPAVVMMAVVVERPVHPTLREITSRFLPALLGGLVLGFVASFLAGGFGAGPVLQLAAAFAGVMVGLLATAAAMDLRAGRPLWRQRPPVALPPVTLPVRRPSDGR